MSLSVGGLYCTTALNVQNKAKNIIENMAEKEAEKKILTNSVSPEALRAKYLPGFNYSDIAKKLLSGEPYGFMPQNAKNETGKSVENVLETMAKKEAEKAPVSEFPDTVNSPYLKEISGKTDFSDCSIEKLSSLKPIS